MLDHDAARGNFSRKRRQPQWRKPIFLSVRKSDGQRQRKGLFRTLRLVRHAIPIAATHDHKGLPIFGPLDRSIAVA